MGNIQSEGAKSTSWEENGVSSCKRSFFRVPVYNDIDDTTVESAMLEDLKSI
jgi:hypothetical protein